MAPFFRKKSHMQKLETTLAQLQLRAAALSDKRTAAQAALAEAITARDRHLVEGDIADEATSDKLQAKVDHYNSTVTGYEAALGTLQKQIADTEQQIAAERSAAERKAASEKLARDLDAIEKALPIYLNAARQLADAVERVAHFHYEANELGGVARNWAAQSMSLAHFLWRNYVRWWSRSRPGLPRSHPPSRSRLLSRLSRLRRP